MGTPALRTVSIPKGREPVHGLAGETGSARAVTEGFAALLAGDQASGTTGDGIGSSATPGATDGHHCPRRQGRDQHHADGEILATGLALGALVGHDTPNGPSRDRLPHNARGGASTPAPVDPARASDRRPTQGPEPRSALQSAASGPRANREQGPAAGPAAVAEDRRPTPAPSSPSPSATAVPGHTGAPLGGTFRGDPIPETAGEPLPQRVKPASPTDSRAAPPEQPTGAPIDERLASFGARPSLDAPNPSAHPEVAAAWAGLSHAVPRSLAGRTDPSSAASRPEISDRAPVGNGTVRPSALVPEAGVPPAIDPHAPMPTSDSRAARTLRRSSVAAAARAVATNAMAPNVAATSEPAGGVSLDLSGLAASISTAASAGPGTHSLSIDLHPPELGHVQALVTVRGDAVSVIVTASSAAGQSALRAHLGELRAVLETASGTPVEVQLSDTGPGSSGADHRRRRAQVDGLRVPSATQLPPADRGPSVERAPQASASMHQALHVIL